MTYFIKKNYLAEANYVDSLIRKFSDKTITILELGCGTGKHAKFLSNKGYKIHGIDRSKSMINLASNNIGVKFEVGDIRKINFKKEFDAILSLFHVFSYQNDVIRSKIKAFESNLISGNLRLRVSF